MNTEKIVFQVGAISMDMFEILLILTYQEKNSKNYYPKEVVLYAEAVKIMKII